MEYQIILDGVEIIVRKKNVKNVNLSVKAPDGRVFVSVPVRMKRKEAEAFLLSRMDWIKTHRQRIQNRPREESNRYKNGGAVWVWGRRYPLEVTMHAPKELVCLKEDRLVVSTREECGAEELEKLLDQWYRKQLALAIPPLLQKWEPVMGVHAKEWRIKKMRTRWGTCNVRDCRVWISLMLAQKPPECLEYVVVHELCHLLERSHNRVFVSYMDRFLPQWRERKARLEGQK